MKSQAEIESYHCGGEDTSGQRKRLILTHNTNNCHFRSIFFSNTSYQYQKRFPYDIQIETICIYVIGDNGILVNVVFCAIVQYCITQI